jgi:hypothetical protein
MPKIEFRVAEIKAKPHLLDTVTVFARPSILLENYEGELRLEVAVDEQPRVGDVITMEWKSA